MKKEVIRRNTRQKQVVLEEMCKVNTHPTAEGIFKLVRKKMPSISFGTVYRNLGLLKQQGKVVEMTCGKYSCRYDASTHNHYHFFCLNCGNIFDLDTPISRELEIAASKRSGFKVEYHRMNFYGYCKKCKAA